MNELTLPIRDKKGEVVRVEKCELPSIKFGTIEKLMDLMDIDEETSSLAVMKKVSGAWKEVLKLLKSMLPTVTDEEWDSIDVKDLIPFILQVIRYTFTEIMRIPVDEKK